MKIKKVLLLLFFALILKSSEKNNDISIILKNKLNMERINEVISIHEKHLTGIDVNKLSAYDINLEIPSQIIDSDQNGKNDTFIFLVNLEANSEKKIILRETKNKKVFNQRAHAEISEKKDFQLIDGIYKGGIYKSVPKSKTPAGHIDHNLYYKFEGPGWESDLIGYRFYLDWRNSIDIFGKKTNEIILPKVGHSKSVTGEDNYHTMADWGMDIFKVGNSIGIGSFAAFENDELVKVSKTDSIICEITEDGPISAAVKTNYYGWEIGNKKANLVSRISINAGSRFTKQIIEVNDVNIIATGLAKHENTEYFFSDNKNWEWNYIALWGKQSLAGDDLGIALFYNQNDLIKLSEDNLNYLVLLKNKNSIEYLYCAVWSGEPNGINTISDFKKYCENELLKINNPIEFDFEKPDGY